MRKEVVFVLQGLNGFGTLPVAIVISYDHNNKPSVDYSKISTNNFKNFENISDENTKKLIKICFELETNVIIQKSGIEKIKSWEEIYDKIFKTREISLKTESIKEYIKTYIETRQNRFFELLEKQKVFLQTGKFPFMWQQLKIAEDMPEIYYNFEYDNYCLKYYPDIEYSGKKLLLSNAMLITRNKARILIDKIIYEFDNSVDGAKLTPFFTKSEVLITGEHVEPYFNKIILPLVPSNKVNSKGFKIYTYDTINSIQLKIIEAKAQQLQLFDSNTDSDKSNIIIDIEFYYDEFKFNYGRSSRSTKFLKENNNYIIKYVSRDFDTENYIVKELKKLGINIIDKPIILPKDKGLDLITENSEEIQKLGIEIVFFDNKNIHNKLFLGERNIEIILDENTDDWFDIKATIIFGEFKIPFLRILNLIKNDKTSFLLPNGELAQIPQAWIEEYKTIFDFIVVKEGNPIISKRLMKIALEKEKADKIKINIRESLRNFFNRNNIENYELPQKFKANLRKYQIYGYNWLRNLDETGFGGFLSDDMGLGKTIQTLALIQWLYEQKRGTILLIVPTSLVYNWINEIINFCTGIKIYEHTGINRIKNKFIFDKFNLIITTYSILRKDIDLFTENVFDYCILDESQYIKNPKSDTANACYRLRAAHYLCLTGTPVENSQSDLWSQMNFLNKGMLGSLNNFMNAIKDEQKAKIYQSLIRPFMLRRKKEEVLQDLPEKIIATEYCDMSEEQYEFYKKIRNFYRDRFIESAKEKKGKINSFVLLEGLTRIRQAANHPILVDNEFTGISGKFNHVLMKINELLQTNSKVLVYSSFVEFLNLFKKYFDDQQISYSYLDGKTKNRESVIKKFNNDSTCNIFLLSLKAGGLGLNLTTAQYVFLLDPWWNPAAEAQAFDRAHRIGQTKTVFIYKFISRLSIEEKILKLQSKKNKIFEDLIDSELRPTEMNIEEILKIIDEN